MIFHSDCCATFDILQYTLCDNVHILKKRLSARLFLNFSFTQLALLPLYYQTLPHLSMPSCFFSVSQFNFQNAMSSLPDILARGVEIFVGYRGREWRHRKNPSAVAGKTVNRLRRHWFKFDFPARRCSYLIRSFKICPRQHHHALNRQSRFFCRLFNELVAPCLVACAQNCVWLNLLHVLSFHLHLLIIFAPLFILIVFDALP